MIFCIKEDLQAYYKQYERQSEFGVSIRRVKMDVDSIDMLDLQDIMQGQDQCDANKRLLAYYYNRECT